MEGSAFVKIVEAELKRRGIKKAAFYEATGISSATFSQWRNDIYSPSSYNIKQVGAFLDISFELVQKKEKPTTSEGSELSKERIHVMLGEMTAEDLSALIADAAAELAKRKTI